MKSAKDLGAPGVDPVYGYGLLNVEAALSPLNFNNLTGKINSDGTYTSISDTSFPSTAIASKAMWEAKGAYVTLFEKTLSSFRDFVIPLSSQLIGQTNYTDGRMFQSYLQSRFWELGKDAGADDNDNFKNFKNFKKLQKSKFVEDQLASQIAGFGNMQASMTLKPGHIVPGFVKAHVCLTPHCRYPARITASALNSVAAMLRSHWEQTAHSN
ncbi:MAG: hypothetical protein U5J78_00650 [Parasphingorhabdus sp.]|nr:hypothetical protein [Parasphingorhabdus sp.]